MKTTDSTDIKAMPQGQTPLLFDIRHLHNTDEIQQPHIHSYFEIIYVLNGSGTCSIDLHQYTIQRSQVFCIKPGQIHQFCLHYNTAGFVICFSETFISVNEIELDSGYNTSFFQLFSKFNGVVLTDEIISDLQEIICKLKKEAEHCHLHKTAILKRYFNIFLIYLSRQFEASSGAVASTRNEELVQNFMRLLDKNFKEKKMVSFYAGALCLTPNYLNEIVKKTTGYAAGYHIRQRIVIEAKRMALYSDNSMKEIAYRLGFLDTAHFSKFFKVIAGENFSEFKKERFALPIAI